MEEKYGEVEEMNVCDNLGDHLVGNVYVKVGFRTSVQVQGFESIRRASSSVSPLAAVSSRGGCRESRYGPEQPLVQRPAHPRRAVARHGLQGSLLPPVRNGVSVRFNNRSLRLLNEPDH